jgi:uncharacterized iron-regulated protein
MRPGVELSLQDFSKKLLNADVTVLIVVGEASQGSWKVKH